MIDSPKKHCLVHRLCQPRASHTEPPAGLPGQEVLARVESAKDPPGRLYGQVQVHLLQGPRAAQQVGEAAGGVLGPCTAQGLEGGRHLARAALLCPGQAVEEGGAQEGGHLGHQVCLGQGLESFSL